MGTEEERGKIKRIESFIKDKDGYRKILATVQREIHIRLYDKRERGMTAEDVVGSLVEKALCNPDIWDACSQPGFKDWVLCQFRNGRHNIVRKKNRHLSIEHESEENGFDPAGDCDHVKDFENSDLFKTVQRELEVKDDTLAYCVLEEVVAGDTNEMIASKYDLDVSDVVNAKKRIRRIGDRLLKNVHRRAAGVQ